MMRHPWRVFAGLIGLLAGLLVMHAVEQLRATGSPSGWSRVDVQTLSSSGGAPRIGSSVWRLARGTELTADSSAKQMYIRARIHGEARLRLSLDGETWVTVGAGTPAQIERPEGASACMGVLTVPQTGLVPLVVERSTVGLTVQSGSSRSTCAGPLAPGPPRLEVRGGTVDLISIGRDRMSDGIPVSPLGWMAGVMLVGFLWIVLTDVALSRRIPFSWMACCWVPVPITWVVLAVGDSPAPHERTVLIGVGGAVLLTVLSTLVGGPVDPPEEE